MATMSTSRSISAASATQQSASPKKPPQKKHYPFWFGGSASCIAACFTHPLDLVKVRMQTMTVAPTTASSAILTGIGSGGGVGAIANLGAAAGGGGGTATATAAMRPSMVGTFVRVVKGEGVLALYSGLSASLLRQLTYSTTRFGVYEYLKTRLTPTPSQTSSSPSFTTLLFLATISGMIGGLAGNPADILNVRMQSDLCLPPHQRYNYRHALHGLLTMLRVEGPTSLFRGVFPNTLRAGMMTAAQLASYDIVKERFLINFLGWDGKSVKAHFTASVAAGLVATTVCSPVDVIKTRVMTARRGGAGVGAGGGVVEVLRETIRREGFSWVFRGWIPSFARLGPHTILMFVFMEQHKKVYDRIMASEAT